MSTAMLRTLLQATSRAQLRAISTSSVRCGQVVVDQEFKDTHYPRVGDREIVGFGTSGEPHYLDMEDNPFPAVRFGKITSEIRALQEKEKGDWKNLSLEERKQLYRYSFRQTLSEKYAPTGEWKIMLSYVLGSMTATFALILMLHYFVYPEPQRTLTPEWRRGMMKRMLRQEQGHVEGYAADYNYEKRDWKK